MMRLLLTILAAIGFAWAALNTSRAEDVGTKPTAEIVDATAERTPQAEDQPAFETPPAAALDATGSATPSPGPRQFGFSRRDARIVIEAKEETWVRISDAEGALVFMRTMKTGETYRVPNRSGLVLDSGNAKGLAIQVDGNPTPALVGMVRRGIELNPDTLQGAMARSRPPVDAPATPAPAVAAEKPVPAVTAEQSAPAVAAEQPVAVIAAEPSAPEKVELPVAEAKPPVAEAKDAPVVMALPAGNTASDKKAAPAKQAVTVPLEAPPVESAPAVVASTSPPPAAEKNEDPPVPSRELLTATLPGPLPSAMPAPADPAPVAPAPAVAVPEPPAAQMAAVAPPPKSAPAPAAKRPPAAHVPAAAPPAVAPAARSEAVKPAALAAAPARAVPPQDKSNSPITGANAVTPSGVIGSTTSRIGLEVQKGTLVRLTQPASTVFVADPEIADIQMKSAGLVYVFGKKAGETALFAVDDRERVVLNTTLVVSHNVSRLRQALRAVAPDAAVEVISVDNSLILTGAVYSPAEAENIRAVAARFVPEPGAIINQLKVLAPNQVNLRVRIAEVSKETLKQFGINWETIARFGGNVLLGVATGRDFINATGTFPRDGATNTIIGSYRNGSQDINAAIDALATEGLITVLAEPNLTAMSGETASFLAGGEFPIPLLQSSNGSSGVTVEFKTFGVGLGFTPHILDDARINLRVRPEVSQLSSAGAVQLSGFSIPALTTRRAETTVELASGQSFVIAGLLQNNTSQDLSKVPLLGDLPVLGALFRSDRFRRNESELVIIVTPYVVRPVSANRIAAPTDGFVAPNDVERILGTATYRQQLNDRSQRPSTKDGQGLIGPSGFQLD